LPEHFVVFRPRDIVSGDFYWMTQKDDKIILVAADCTGHGVPGAFMSMLGMSFLNEIVNKSAVTQADVILNELREHVITQLKQSESAGSEETKDGMDIALMVVDKKKQELQFAGANNPLYVVRPLSAGELANPVSSDDLPRGTMRNDRYELRQINADKMPIGTSAHNDVPFSISKLPLVSGYSLYIFTDGYEDQFGGPMGKKLMSKALKRILLSIQEKTMEEQKEILQKNMEDWRGDLEQVDDILLIGFKVV
jgi:serine phosphatase RsbU (regulator of sigma subunit)